MYTIDIFKWHLLKQGGIKIHKKLHRAAKFRPGQPHGIVQRNVNGVAKLSEIYIYRL